MNLKTIFEICEDDLTVKTYFAKIYKNCVLIDANIFPIVIK